MKICIVNPGATNQLLGKQTSFGGAEERSIQICKILNSNNIAQAAMVTSEPVSISEITTFVGISKPVNTLIQKIQNRLSKYFPFVYPPEEIELEENAWNSDIFVVFGVSVMAYSVLRQCKKRHKKFILAITSDDCLECELSLQLITRKNAFRCPRWMGYSLIKKADQIWVQTTKQKKKLFESFQITGLQIPNPAPFSPVVNPPSFSERSGVLWIGKASDVKDPLSGLKMAARLPDIPFTFVINNLSNPLGQECLRIKSENAKILESVSRSELPSLLSKSKVLVNTSQFEGMPNTFIEAWAHGLPTLSLNACKELFEKENCPGKYGNNSDDEMIQLISLFVRDETCWQTHSLLTKKFLNENHSAEAIISTLRIALNHL